MEKMGSAAYGFLALLAGALLMIGGWWISMLNISVDRMSDPDFTSFWTLFGLVMIFFGAYLPFLVIGMRGRYVRKRREVDDLHRQLAGQSAQQQGAVQQSAQGQPAAPSEPTGQEPS